MSPLTPPCILHNPLETTKGLQALDPGRRRWGIGNQKDSLFGFFVVFNIVTEGTVPMVYLPDSGEGEVPMVR